MENENDIVSSNNSTNNSKDQNDKIPSSSPLNIFCKYKSEINNQNENGWTPIYRSIISNNLIILKELLDLGANVDIPNNMNETPLYQCVEMENYDAMIILLKYNCDCNISKKNGNTPLHLATKKGKINFISALLRHGANPNLCNKLFNQTPFHVAVIEKLSKDIISLFKNFNADLYIKDKYDKTPFDYAVDNGDDYKKMVEIIFKEGFDNCKGNLIQNDFKNDTPKKTSSKNTMKFPEKFTSSELIAKGGDFDSSKSKSLIIKNENSKIYSNINNEENENNENIQTIKKINGDFDTSDFNFSTPKNLINNNLINIPDSKMFNLDNGIKTIKKPEKTNKNNIQSNQKDIISEMNPLDLINQVITTTNNSNIFSELQMNTQPDKLNTNSIKESEEDIKEDSKIENNNEYIPTLGTNDMEYSKSKSYFVSDLPQVNTNKQNQIDFLNININEHSPITINNSNDEDKENKNPNLIHIEENTLSEEQNSSFLPRKIKYNTITNPKNNMYQITTSSNCDSNINNTSSINKEIKILNLNPNYSNLYTNNSTGTTQKPSSFYNNNNKTNKTIPNNKNNNDKCSKFQNNHPSLINPNHLNGNITFNTFNTPLYNIHKKKSSLLSEYAFQKNNVVENYNDEYQKNEQISKLKEWLISCDLISYLNLLLSNNLYDIKKCIEGMKKGELNVSFKDVEDLGIRKPGHIFRFLLKLQIDCGKIEHKIINYLLSVCTSTNNIAITTDNIKCGCCKVKKENSSTNYCDINSYLESKNLGYLKDNFIHNGFEYVDYIIIQIFSKYNFTNEILIDYLHIYNSNDRKKVLNIFLNERKKICDDLNIPYEDNENHLDIETGNFEKGKICSIF